ncbi:hypothetical protein BU23DRAFT_3149 [Bimuria novae-zelandiae CBS 107.79]|uniref:Uncharacterized protein n=1 Tax=Bimuria novae-zelandiae CBS 107.79 TaxID=1447943 RepID=A0A6A5W3V7_9PLEO|nr:hypothetical protein BU23DRAFT_3149 [Bimuria novae-zelandiae CBS 107.79]
MLAGPSSSLDEIEARKSASFRAFDKCRFGDWAGYSEAEAYRTRDEKEHFGRKLKNAAPAGAKDDRKSKLKRSTEYPTDEAEWRRKAIATTWQQAASEKQANLAVGTEQLGPNVCDGPWPYSDLVYEYKLLDRWSSLEPKASRNKTGK